jgi:hypothetical protein
VALVVAETLLALVVEQVVIGHLLPEKTQGAAQAPKQNLTHGLELHTAFKSVVVEQVG